MTNGKAPEDSICANQVGLQAFVGSLAVLATPILISPTHLGPSISLASTTPLTRVKENTHILQEHHDKNSTTTKIQCAFLP